MINYIALFVISFGLITVGSATTVPLLKPGSLGTSGGFLNILSRNYADCPACDRSVYSYCSYKLAEDSCCCNGAYAPGFPYCAAPNCINHLHANTCLEHALIVRCCCNRPYRK